MRASGVLAMLMGIVALPLVGRAENWAQWRGPNFNGSTSETKLPEKLDQGSMLWSTQLPGHGAGTPIVWGERVFVSAQETGTQKLLALCVHARTGQVLWKREMGMGYGNPPGRLNDMASPSALTDGKSVVFYFGTGDLAAFDMEGKPLWARNLQKDHGSFNVLYLYGSSPLLYKGKLYVPVLHRDQPWTSKPTPTAAVSYLLAIDPATGKDLFKHIRPEQASGESKESYCTPLPYEGQGRSEIVIVGADCVTGHDPETGKELWRCGGWNDRHEGNLRIVPSIVLAGGRFVVCTPKSRGFVLAIKPGGSGLVTETHIAWQNREIKSDVCVPLYYQDNLYVLDGDFKKGLNCLDPATGQIKWSTRIESRPPLRTSPTGADGKIYLMNEAGDVWVIAAADGKILSQTSLGSEGRARASLSVSQGQVFVRTGDKLLSFGTK